MAAHNLGSEQLYCTTHGGAGAYDVDERPHHRGHGPDGAVGGGVPSVVLERDDCIASLWQSRIYDHLRLHLPKHFCELPDMPFPVSYPEYPTKHQFVSYLESYAAAFHVRPRFRQSVASARFDHAAGLWHVQASSCDSTSDETSREYIGRWLVVATGENAERVLPEFTGAVSFKGPLTHVSKYKSGESYRGSSMLVVGCGNSSMEVCLDLCDHGARPAMVAATKY